MLVLTWILQTGQRPAVNPSGTRQAVAAPAILGLTAFILFFLYLFCVPESVTTELAPHARANFSRLPAWAEPLIFAISAVSFLLLIMYGLCEPANSEKLLEAIPAAPSAKMDSAMVDRVCAADRTET